MRLKVQAVKPHIAKYKKRIVEEFAKLISDYPIVGVLDVENLPAPQFQKMRESLRDRVVIRMAKRRLIRLAIENCRDKKKGIEQLEEHLVGMPALVFTRDEPFNLSKILRKSKSKAPAKAGQTAPSDIVVQAGPTPFAPGPVIGELNSIGIKTGVEGGKVTIVKETTVVRAGEQINARVAGILARLGITPMEIGLDLVAAYENGVVFTKGVLSIDEEEYLDKIKTAVNDSFNLSVSIGYLTKDNIEILIKKAFNEAKALATSKGIISDEYLKGLIGKAEAQGVSLKSTAKIEFPKKEIEKLEKEEEEKAEEMKSEGKPVVEEKKDEVKEEKKAEEKPVKEKIKKEEKVAESEVEELIKKEEKAEFREEVEEGIREESKQEERAEEKKEPEELELLESIKSGGVEVKQKITEEEMKKAEEFVNQLRERAAGIKKEEPQQKPEIQKQEKAEEKKQETERTPEVDEKIKEMVKKTREFGAGIRPPTAGDIVKEAEKEVPKPERREEIKLPSLQELAEQAKKREKEKKKSKIPSAHELASRKKKEK